MERAEFRRIDFGDSNVIATSGPLTAWFTATGFNDTVMRNGTLTFGNGTTIKTEDFEDFTPSYRVRFASAVSEAVKAMLKTTDDLGIDYDETVVYVDATHGAILGNLLYRDHNAESTDVIDGDYEFVPAALGNVAYFKVRTSN